MTDPTSNTAEIYDAFAKEYRAYSEGKAAYIRAVDNLITERFKNKTGILLDYGSGDGVRGAALFRELSGKELYQADISAEMVKQCRALGQASAVFKVDESDWASEVPRADLAVCLWNVLGHIPGTEARIAVLKDIHRALKPNAPLCIDVNNRHYVGYGFFRSLFRRCIDSLWRDDSRGDVKFTWKIDGRNYPASGHFFTPKELRDLLETAGFDVEQALSVDYENGSVSENLTQGQIFILAKKNDD
ncbi:MAG: class I SAM-dependent methyltransferase [Hyphomicrobiales bacterium]